MPGVSRVSRLMAVAARVCPGGCPAGVAGLSGAGPGAPPAVRPPGTVEVLASSLSHTPAVTSPTGSGNGPGWSWRTRLAPALRHAGIAWR